MRTVNAPRTWFNEASWMQCVVFQSCMSNLHTARIRRRPCQISVPGFSVNILLCFAAPYKRDLLHAAQCHRSDGVLTPVQGASCGGASKTRQGFCRQTKNTPTWLIGKLTGNRMVSDGGKFECERKRAESDQVKQLGATLI